MRYSLLNLALALLCFCGAEPWTVSAEPASAEVASPLSPEDSLRHFQLDEQLAIEIAAAEPEVVDPVAMRFDEAGRMWVAQMGDYPLGPPRGQPGEKRTEQEAQPLSSIKVLQDKDGDGRFETATLFADKLLFVTGLQPWKGGVIVTLSGRVAYLKDTNGDGRADLDETWFTGFAQSNSQLRANHPTLALDNHVYIANGLRGGMVVNHLKKLRAAEKAEVPAEQADPPINISGMDFRFDPLTGEAEAVSGNGQFGLCFDDWGNRFVCSNRNPCQHVVLENRYLKQAPTVAVASVVQDVAAAGEKSRIFPISRFWTTSNLHEGQFTAACGVFIYRGDLLPSAFRGNVFTCDPTGNLIHREIMRPQGATFTSQPAYEGKEFLASPDTWFRPVGMELGPDGALYVIDMYRAVIEHPEWVPDELKNRPDERFGDDRGRIYRIVPKDRRATDPNANQHRLPPGGLSQVKTDELLPLLESPNAWQRETAQRIILERQEKEALAAIVKRGENANNLEVGAQEQTQIHLLWLLSGLGGATDEAIAQIARSGNSKVSRQCVLLLEGDTKAPERARAYARSLIDYADRPDSFLFLLHPSAASASDGSMSHVAMLAWQNAADPWMRQAALLGNPDGVAKELASLLAVAKKASPSQLLLIREWGIFAGATRPDAECREVLAAAAGNHSQDFEHPAAHIPRTLLDALGMGRERSKLTLTSLVRDAESDKTIQEYLETARRGCEKLSQDGKQSAELRSEAIAVIRHFPQSASVLEKLALSETDQGLRLLAIESVPATDSLEVWKKLVADLSAESPAIRHAVLDRILQQPERTLLLLDALDAGTFKPAELDPVQTGRLQNHADAKIRERVAKIFGSATPADRQQALADYQPALVLEADPQRGQVVFQKNCSTCHKIGNLGVNVAPDISDSRTKTPAQLLGDIIQPNRAIDANYIAYQLLTKDGTIASGILTSETSTSITLKQPEAKVITVARSEIEQLKSSGVSLMPDGLEKTIPPQAMADLISFIKNWRYLDGRIPAGK